MTRHFFTPLAGLLFAAVFCAGCGRSPSTAPDDKQAAAPRQTDAGEITFQSQNGFESKDGEEVRYAGGKTSVAMPKGFPGDVAVYPKATVTMSATDKNSVMVVLNTADAPEKAQAFYKECLEKNGWKISSNLNTAQGSMFVAEKKNRKLTLTVTPESEGTVIQIAVIEEDGK